mmetsp:Transcript_95785/g.189892  ORF Transcript_95785/g.189892 Transcript_95785/m.189892 type:complete len:101 (+) Transcript_95785:426-728(+)
MRTGKCATHACSTGGRLPKEPFVVHTQGVVANPHHGLLPRHLQRLACHLIAMLLSSTGKRHGANRRRNGVAITSAKAVVHDIVIGGHFHTCPSSRAMSTL